MTLQRLDDLLFVRAVEPCLTLVLQPLMAHDLCLLCHHRQFLIVRELGVPRDLSPRTGRVVVFLVSCVIG